MENRGFDLSNYNFSFSLRNKIGRVIWSFCYFLLFRPFNLETFKGWRSFILKSFGAKIGHNTSIQASVRIWAPWNLEVGSFSSIGPKVDCYNQGKIKIGDHTVISQKTYLCASSHDYTLPDFPLICQYITIGNKVWVAADAFIGPTVNIGEGAVVGARSAVFKDVAPWTVVGGNPAKMIKNRGTF
ncbi:MAG: putative colanic acid biosynthesis acetyltransferase [Cyclobacterium sp.]|uniref:putative colanic acid biosynthesis acetyltransferase n=1 Tax=Cyclobacterium sp. TaxID=1966343 RepID=UPI003970CC9E